MFYLYILFSDKAGHYYVGHTDDPDRRLFEHNNPQGVSYSSKHIPWKIVFKYPVSDNRSDAIIIEKYIKKRKSKGLLMKLIDKQEDSAYLDGFFRKILIKRKTK